MSEGIPHRVTLRLDDDLRQKLAEYLSTHGGNASQAIRTLLDLGMASLHGDANLGDVLSRRQTREAINTALSQVKKRFAEAANEMFNEVDD